MAKRSPLSDIDTIKFQYFEAGYNPNKPHDPKEVVMGPSVIWGKFHGEWHLIPEEFGKNVRTIVGNTRRLLAKVYPDFDGTMNLEDTINRVITNEEEKQAFNDLVKEKIEYRKKNCSNWDPDRNGTFMAWMLTGWSAMQRWKEGKK